MKIRSILLLTVVFSATSIFANNQQGQSSESKLCAVIAKACVNAGYVRNGTQNKRFWQDCMKPILLNQTVKGVTVDATTVKTCRANKIKKLQNEVKELQKVS